MMSDTPPRTVEAPKAKRTRKAGTGGRKASLKPRLESSLASMGMAVAIFDPYDGKCILEGSEGLAESLDKWAKESPAVRRAIEAFLVTSTFAEVAMAIGAITVPIAAHHGLLPAQVAEMVGAPVRTPPSPGDPGVPTQLVDFPKAAANATDD